MNKNSIIILTIIFSLFSSTGTTFLQASTTVINTPPNIAITSPENDSTYTAGSNITITATASEIAGTVSSVSYYNGSTLLGQSNKFPYSYIWTNVTAGTYTLTAVAAADGVSSTSSPVTVKVTTALPVPPEVDITSPVNNTTFTAGSNISLAAVASEANGTVSTVSFYNGSTLLTTNNLISSLSNYTWENVPAGVYVLTAVATDANNVSSTSRPIKVTVTSSSEPLIAIISPADQSTFTAGSSIVINAAASKNSSTITEVFFYYGTYFLGSSTSSPLYKFTWKNVPVGSYALTVEATDNNGGTIVSAPINVTIAAPIPITPPALKSPLTKHKPNIA